jgi:hypothetical protein
MRRPHPAEARRLAVAIDEAHGDERRAVGGGTTGPFGGSDDVGTVDGERRLGRARRSGVLDGTACRLGPTRRRGDEEHGDHRSMRHLLSS